MSLRAFVPWILALSLAGCGALEERLDCNDICGDYDSCLPAIDVEECVERCEDQDHADIDDCDACLDSEGATCGDCAAECADLAL